MKANNLDHDQTMKTRIPRTLLAALLLLSTLNFQHSPLFAQGTAFNITVTADVAINEGLQVAMPDNVTTTKSDVHVFHFQPGHYDRAFHFIAVGPR